jgi:YidC/Oxa1 family membrane protein insertase
MVELWNEYLYTPIYNLLVFFVGVVPGGDVGLAVIAVTLFIKVLLAPLSFAALKTQKAVKIMEPELKKIREKYKDDRETQAKELFALYKKYDVKPLASFLTFFIQIPILIALYFTFLHEKLPQIDTDLLYSFVAIPETISPLFLGAFLISSGSVALAALAGLTQFAQSSLMMKVPEKKPDASMQEEFGRSMALQMRYAMPIIIAAVAYYTSGAVALYFIASNTVGIVQELIARRTKFTFPDPQED